MDSPAVLHDIPSPAGPSARLAGVCCLIGFFLYLVLSPPLLDSIGFHYAGDNGAPYEKVHPATYFIFLALVVLFVKSGNALGLAADIARNHLPYAALFVYYIIALAYMGVRDAPVGLAFMIDGHLGMAAGAIVLCYVPRSTCKKIIGLFVIMACLNSAIGLVEGMLKARFFPFTEEGAMFLHEEYFRASALLGHPLANATFTAVALFVTLALPLRPLLKYSVIALLLASLVAFGGRSALVFSLFFLLAFGAINLVERLRAGNLSMLQGLSMAAAALVVPLALIAGLYLLLNSSLGERLLAHSNVKDESATSRLLAFSALGYMSDVELWLGVSSQRMLDITDMMRQHMDFAYIENPWVMLLMHFGIIQFTIWLLLTICFMATVIRKQPLALKMALLLYFVIASGYNSFGVKEIGNALIILSIICASRIITPEQRQHG